MGNCLLRKSFQKIELINLVPGSLKSPEFQLPFFLKLITTSTGLCRLLKKYSLEINELPRAAGNEGALETPGQRSLTQPVRNFSKAGVWVLQGEVVIAADDLQYVSYRHTTTFVTVTERSCLARPWHGTVDEGKVKKRGLLSLAPMPLHACKQQHPLL